MTDLADHPMLREAASAPPQMIADWLSDQSATLGDVLALVIGEPPFGEGLPHRVLAEWLRANEPSQYYISGPVSGPLHEVVASVEERETDFGDPDRVLTPEARARRRRDMLRRLLALFGDEPVRVVRRSRTLDRKNKMLSLGSPDYGGIADEVLKESWLTLDQGAVGLHPAWPIEADRARGWYVLTQAVPARWFGPSESAIRCYGPGTIGKLRPPHLGLLPRRKP